MRWLRTVIYGYGFFVFGLMCFCFLPIVLPLAFLPARVRKPLQRWIRAITHLSFVFVRWHCKLTGFATMKLFDQSRGDMSPLLVANHLSMFDIVLLFSYFPDIHTLVNAKFMSNPLLWPIIRACGYVALRTDSAAEGYQAYRELAAMLEAGERLVLFPEGTRSSDGRLGPLKSGPFRLAAELKIPMTPVFFTCNQPFLNRHSFIPREPGPVLLYAYIGPALRPATDQDMDAKSARTDFMQAYEAFTRSDLALAWNKASTHPHPSQHRG